MLLDKDRLVATKGSPLPPHMRCAHPLTVYRLPSHARTIARSADAQIRKLRLGDASSDRPDKRGSCLLSPVFLCLVLFDAQRASAFPATFVLRLDGFEPLDLVREALRLVNFGQLDTSTQVTTPAGAGRGLLLLPKRQLVGLGQAFVLVVDRSLARWRGTPGGFHTPLSF